MPIPLRPSSIAAIGLAVLATASAARTQDQTDWDAAVVKACEHRRYGMRRAVSKRIAQAGAEAVPAIRAYAEAHGSNAIPMLLVNAVATDGTRDHDVVVLLRDWARDRDFYWRAQALAGLVDRGLHNRFGKLYREAVSDPSHLYRLEGMRGSFRDRNKDRGWAETALTEDPDPRVRIRLACSLAEKGATWTQGVVLAALEQRNVFLGDPWGAREAMRALNTVKSVTDGQDFGYDLSASVADNAEALIAIRKALSDGPVGPAASFADAPGPFAGGINLRSCRNGDLFLRWTDDGEVFAGLLGDRKTRLRAGAWPTLHERLGALVTERSVSGKVVCDFLEVVHGPHRTKCAPGAVPAEVAAWLRELAGALEASPDGSFGAELQSRLGQFADGR